VLAVTLAEVRPGRWGMQKLPRSFLLFDAMKSSSERESWPLSAGTLRDRNRAEDEARAARGSCGIRRRAGSENTRA